MIDTCGTCGGPSGTGAVLDDTSTGQKWLCGGCQVGRRTAKRAASLALLEAAQATGSTEYAKGIEVAVKELTGAHLPAQREEVDATYTHRASQTVKARTAVVPHLRLVITGMFCAGVATFGGIGLWSSAAFAGDPTTAVEAAPRPPHTRRRAPHNATAAAHLAPQHPRAARPAPSALAPGLLAVRSAAVS